MNIKRYISHKKRLIDSALNKYLPSIRVKPQIIHKVMRYAVFPGGKRIRPVLTLASFEMCGGRAEAILPAACAIELIHTYTLIHDDLPCMDDDDFRRGRLSCHKKFSENLALLAGNALLTLSFQLLSEAGNLDIINCISKAIGSYGTIAGQAVDIERMLKSAHTKVGRKELDYIISCKTGRLFEVAVKIAGIRKGVDKKELDGLGNFGRLIGFTFQLVDDLIDKDGYVKLYGADYARKRAGLLTHQAKRHLDIFGARARRLHELADLILNRRY